MSAPATILTQFHNEELLLGFWLRHHRELFDHGVLLDHGSTDASREIIRELVPDWEVVPSRNPLLDARDTDLEIMQLEQRYGGWKLALTVTEFLLTDDLRGHLGHSGTLGVPCVTMVDAPHEHDTELDDRPLFLQRHHHVPDAQPRLRFLHSEPHGDYMPGRHDIPGQHSTEHELVILKYTWSPYPQVKGRRLQIAQAIPEADVRLGMSWAHFATGEELDEQFAGLSPMARDLREDPSIASTLHRLSGRYAHRQPEPVPRLIPDPRRRVAVLGSDLGGVIAERHQLVDSPTDAEIVIGGAGAWTEQPAVRGTYRPLVVDLRDFDPAEADETMLLRGDFFVWDDASADRWLTRFVGLGRVPSSDSTEVNLLGATYGPHLTEALERFLATPRRTTSRVAADSTLGVSRLAYFHRQKAAVDTLLSTAGRLTELTNENARLREEIERLRGA